MSAGVGLCDGVQAAACQSPPQGVDNQLEAAPQRAASTARQVLRGSIQKLLAELMSYVA